MNETMCRMTDEISADEAERLRAARASVRAGEIYPRHSDTQPEPDTDALPDTRPARLRTFTVFVRLVPELDPRYTTFRAAVFVVRAATVADAKNDVFNLILGMGLGGMADVTDLTVSD